MNVMKALIKREFLENKNGFFWTPIVLSAVVVFFIFISALGVGKISIGSDLYNVGVTAGDNHLNFAEALELAEEKTADKPGSLPLAVTFLYWSLSLLAQIALPFVIVFALLGSLYEERRDKSILFWKSMPVSDAQEVGAKLFTASFGASASYLSVALVAMLVMGVLLSIVSLFQGGPILVLWPIGYLAVSVFAIFVSTVMIILWLAPILTWLTFVSAYAKRMPLMFAIVPPLFLGLLEAQFFGTYTIVRWFALHSGGWMFVSKVFPSEEPESAIELANRLYEGFVTNSLATSFGSADFWLGLVFAAGLFWATVQLRKRAI